MCQWDAVDTSPDLGGQNILKTFKIAMRCKRRTTRTELERVFRRWLYFHLRSEIIFGPLTETTAPTDLPLILTTT